MTELDRAAGQVLIAGFAADFPDPRLLEAAAADRLGGIILFRRNIGTPESVADLIRQFQEATAGSAPLLVAVDQEGGRVQRLRDPILELPPMSTLGTIDDPDLTRRAGDVLGRQLKALGFNLNFAPVLDVNTNPMNPIIGDRAFGSDPARVVTHARAFAEGLHAAGVLACGKHFPGHGDTDTDSHLALPRLKHDRKRLERIELAPFRALGPVLPSIMTAHVLFEALDPGIPATLSRRVVHELLRGELGYEGVIISDDLEMKAIHDQYGIADAAVRSIDAGCDAVLICSRTDEVEGARAALVERATADRTFAARLLDAATRVSRLRQRCPAPSPKLTAAELDALFKDQASRAVKNELLALGLTQPRL